MGSRRVRNKLKHEFSGTLTWDESAIVCRRCDQFKCSWMHEPKVPWWKFWRK